MLLSFIINDYGYLNAQAAGLSGFASQEWVASGTLAAQRAGLSGSAFAKSVGTGYAAVEGFAQLFGTAEAWWAVEGTLAAQEGALSGSANMTSIAVGELAAQQAALSGVAAPISVATGTLIGQRAKLFDRHPGAFRRVYLDVGPTNRLTAQRTPLELFSGDSVEIIINIADEDGLPINLVGSDVVWKMATSDWRTNPDATVLSKSSDTGGGITLSNGQFTVWLLSGDTKGLAAASYYYECQITMADGTVGTVLSGRLKLKANLVEPR